MRIETLKINNIPAVIWGEKSEKVFIAVHGNMSNKSDEVIRILAENVCKCGYQVLSFDLPEHGERKSDTTYLCKVQNCVSDLNKIIDYAKKNYKEISVFACSIGAYFSLLVFKNEEIRQCLFLSPIVNMEALIKNMMLWSNTSEKDLEEKLEVKTDFGQILYWDYYCYVKENPIKDWKKKTAILYGSKDNMQNEEWIRDFSEKNKCKLDILDNGEHFFHTKEQLDYYEKWIQISLKLALSC